MIASDNYYSEYQPSQPPSSLPNLEEISPSVVNESSKIEEATTKPKKKYLAKIPKIVPDNISKLGLCPCQKKCNLKISVEHQQKLFKEYCDLPNFNLKKSYLLSCIKVTPKCRTYTTNKNSKRQNTRLYFLSNSNGEKVFVCKAFFKNTYFISDGRITRLLKNKSSVPTPPLDRRTLDNKIQVIRFYQSKTVPSYE